MWQFAGTVHLGSVQAGAKSSHDHAITICVVCEDVLCTAAHNLSLLLPLSVCMSTHGKYNTVAVPGYGASLHHTQRARLVRFLECC